MFVIIITPGQDVYKTTCMLRGLILQKLDETCLAKDLWPYNTMAFLSIFRCRGPSYSSSAVATQCTPQPCSYYLRLSVLLS